MEKIETHTDIPLPPRSIGIRDVAHLKIGHCVHVETEVQAECARIALRSLGRGARRRMDKQRGGYLVWRDK